MDANRITAGIVHAVDWSHNKSADVVNISASMVDISCSEGRSTSYDMVINEAVDKGMVVDREPYAMEIGP